MKISECFFMSDRVLGFVCTLVIVFLAGSALAYPAPRMVRLYPATVVRVTAITVTPAEQPQWMSGQFAGISNHLTGLETAMRREFGSVNGTLDKIDDGNEHLLKSLDEERREHQLFYSKLTDHLARTRSATDALTDELHIVSGRLDDTIQELSYKDAALADDIDWLDRTVTCLVLGFVALAFVLLYRLVAVKRQFPPVNGVVTSPPITPSIRPLVPILQQPVSDAGMSPAGTGNECLHVWGQIDSPDEVLQHLKALATAMGITPPTIPDEQFASVITTKGHVRSDNQDYCLGLQMGGITAILIADGCGGASHGAYASYTAVREAAMFLVRAKCGIVPQDIVPLARQALFHASDAMGKHAAAAKPPVKEGFRTTLIIILVDSQRYAFAYAGDGGGMVVRKNGTVEKFLFPQKADLDIPNVLATSLGPVLEGEPASGAVPRYSGDLLLTGTDGIWDYVGPNFPLAAAQSLAKTGGNAMLATRAIVQELADFTDAAGHICTDNLTLGLLSDPVRAAIPPKGATPISKST